MNSVFHWISSIFRCFLFCSHEAFQQQGASTLARQQPQDGDDACTEGAFVKVMQCSQINVFHDPIMVAQVAVHSHWTGLTLIELWIWSALDEACGWEFYLREIRVQISKDGVQRLGRQTSPLQVWIFWEVESVRSLCRNGFNGAYLKINFTISYWSSHYEMEVRVL